MKIIEPNPASFAEIPSSEVELNLLVLCIQTMLADRDCVIA